MTVQMRRLMIDLLLRRCQPFSPWPVASYQCAHCLIADKKHYQLKENESGLIQKILMRSTFVTYGLKNGPQRKYARAKLVYQMYYNGKITEIPSCYVRTDQFIWKRQMRKNIGIDQSARAAHADQSLYGILLTCFRQTFQESILSKKVLHRWVFRSILSWPGIVAFNVIYRCLQIFFARIWCIQNWNPRCPYETVSI